nr:tegument host shutoff protein-like protein [Phocid alphaherpesvirus 1]
MGLFGLLKYAYSRMLVKHDAISTPPGIYTPIAVDLWNVMYTLMEKFCKDGNISADSATVTAECFFSLLKLLQKRSYLPIFVSDRGIYGDGQVKRGAKAIATQTMCHQGGSGRLGEIKNTEGNMCGEILKTYDDLEKPTNSDSLNVLSARWSSLVNTPKLCYRLCVNLIRHLGFPYVNVSDMEADDVCANLYHTNTAAQVYTTDTDLILMGCDIILDVVPLFPPTLRCRDILASLNLSYPEFLCRFVRCHTDLHQAPILKSVQSIIQNKHENSNSDSGDSSCEEESRIKEHENYITQIPDSWRISESISTDNSSSSDESSNETSSESSDTDSFGIPKNHNGFKALSKINSPSNKAQLKRVMAIEENSLNLKYTSRFPPIMKTVSRSLTMLPAPQTKHEVLERKFIKHLATMITPEHRGENLSILKRVPINQERFDINLVYETLLSFIDDKERAKYITNLFWKYISIPPDYNLALVSYWDDSKSRRWI